MQPPLLTSESGTSEPPDPNVFRTHDLLSAAIYPELKRIAYARMSQERSDHTWQATALINELYLRLLQKPDFAWKDRSHFLLSASQAMRHLLVDHAREKNSEKRGSGWVRTELADADMSAAPSPELILDVDRVLERLARREPRMAQVVELKFFGGLTFAEIGAVVGIDERTAKRDWTLARMWLSNHLREGASNDSGRMGAN